MAPDNSRVDFAPDLEAIAGMEAVPKILEVICRTTGLGFAAVARVTERRWIACAVRDEIAFGLVPGGELEVATTLCDEIRASGEPILIDQVSADTRYCGHPTPAKYGFQSYVSVPIYRVGGDFFGTLCAIDPRPARVNTRETMTMFTLFAELIAFHLDAHERLKTTELALLDERRSSELRDQFIAVLGHDLRNPLGAIDAAASVLSRAALPGKSAEMVLVIKRSVARMADLIHNVLDFARGRLGGGLTVARAPDPRLGAMLDQVVNELRTAMPARSIESDIVLDRPVSCDSGRIGQLLSNLLGNALEHGAVDAPIRVRARTQGEQFELSVANRGVEIPAHLHDKLFEPFYRAAFAPQRPGLGLGLYISSEIARAHQGRLRVRSADGETVFTFEMPLQ
jgi:signal transduction histidine kinase